MRVLITGVGGLAGSHAAAYLVAQGHDVVGMARTTPDRLTQLGVDIPIIRHDLTNPIPVSVSHAVGDIDAILNYASSTDISGSVVDPWPVFDNNIRVVANLTEWVRWHPVGAFVHISSEEVYGPAPDHPHVEWEPIRPSTHYSASKAAQEAYLIASWRSHGLPLILLNSMNLIGPMQDDSKLVPTIIRRTIAGEQVPLLMAWYEPQSGSGEESLRQFMHPRVLASAALHVVDAPERWWAPNVALPPRFNVAGTQVGVVQLAHMIAAELGLPLHWLPVDADSSRPGHERIFALDDSKLRATGWVPPTTLEDDIRDTVAWYVEHA